MSMNLPVLSDEAKHHPDCCLSLSRCLVERLSQLFVDSARPGFVLSVGSGSGLLEALIVQCLQQRQIQDLWVEGVEVACESGQMNRHLPEELNNIVEGTWALYERASTASALMFVYPRAPRLVQQYLGSIMQNTSDTRLVIWLGPKADWNDFVACFESPGFNKVYFPTECGLLDYELMAVLTRKSD